MDTTENATVAAEPTEALLDPALTVLEEPMSLSAAIEAMDADGWLTAVVPVPLWAPIDSRVEDNGKSGEDYTIVNRMVADPVIPVQTSFDAVGVRADRVLLLNATFKLCEALSTSHDEEELAELEAQGARRDQRDDERPGAPRRGPGRSHCRGFCAAVSSRSPRS